MNFLKKWISCIVSFVTGVCGLVLSICPGMFTKIASNNETVAQLLKANGLGNETTNAFKVLTDNSLYTEAKNAGIGSQFMVMKVFAIITLVISILLIVFSIVMLLKNLDVIKSECKIFEIAGLCLFATLLISTIGLLISSNLFAVAQEEKVVEALEIFGTYASLIKVDVSIGVYQPIMLVVSIISAIAVGTFTLINKKRV